MFDVGWEYVVVCLLICSLCVVDDIDVDIDMVES